MAKLFNGSTSPIHPRWTKRPLPVEFGITPLLRFKIAWTFPSSKKIWSLLDDKRFDLVWVLISGWKTLDYRVDVTRKLRFCMAKILLTIHRRGNFVLNDLAVRALMTQKFMRAIRANIHYCDDQWRIWYFQSRLDQKEVFLRRVGASRLWSSNPRFMIFTRCNVGNVALRFAAVSRDYLDIVTRFANDASKINRKFGAQDLKLMILANTLSYADDLLESLKSIQDHAP